jgi:V8-like Glu-specific endopeptidase
VPDPVNKAKPLLGFADLKTLIAAAESAGLVDPEARRPLFARIYDIKNRLAVSSVPRTQLVTDITTLNEYAIRPGQIPPLITWLENAIVFAAGAEEESTFQEFVDRYSPGEPAAPAPPQKDTELPEYNEAIVFRDEMVPFGYLQGGINASLSVARLLVPRYDDGVAANKGYWGTAWLLSPTELMTNHHVLNARDRDEKDQPASDDDFKRQALATQVQFDVNDDEAAYPVIGVTGLGSSDAKLDYAILQIEEQPGRKALPIRKAPFNITKKDYVPVNIIQHPRGGAKKIALRNNLATGKTKTDLRYFTDTLPGSSGSPVLDDNWQVVALHRGSTAVDKIQYQGRKTAVMNLGTLVSVIVKALGR